MEKLKGINLHVIRSFTELTCQGMGFPLTYTTPAHVTNLYAQVLTCILLFRHAITR